MDVEERKKEKAKSKNIKRRRRRVSGLRELQQLANWGRRMWGSIKLKRQEQDRKTHTRRDAARFNKDFKFDFKF